MAEPQPRMLSLRAKRMYAQETINLALAYPYLAPILDEYVFTPYWHADLKAQIVIFSTSLIHLGLRKLYPDAIAVTTCKRKRSDLQSAPFSTRINCDCPARQTSVSCE